MAILVRVNGNASGEGFLIAAEGARTFPATVGLRTDDASTQNAVLQIAPGGAAVTFQTTNIQITGTEKFVEFHSTTASTARNDTVLQVTVGGIVQASFNLTSISSAKLWFKGGFQVRFATDFDMYTHPTGTNAGWNWTLEGEADFVGPVPGSIPQQLDQVVGREIRFNNPLNLRSHARPVGVTVVGVTGTAGATSQEFLVGDPIIGTPVNLGPASYFAANDNGITTTVPPPEESPGAGKEPIANFEFHVGNVFSGKSKVGPFVGVNVPRVPNDRPKTLTIAGLSDDEKAQYGIPEVDDFVAGRMGLLLADYLPIPLADRTGTAAGRNLRKRIGHLGGATAAQIMEATGISALNAGDLGFHAKEEYNGLINDAVQFSPTNSAIINYLSGFNSFDFFAKFFNYHTDDQVGQVHGSVSGRVTDMVPELQTGVYSISSRSTAAFNDLPTLTVANIDAALGGMGVAEFAVVTVSTSGVRLVVSKAVLTTPAAPATSAITSRGETVIGELVPEGSLYLRDLLFRILPPNHERNVLGSCEGTPFAPPPVIGLARLFADGNVWKLLLHAGTQGANGVTYKGTYALNSATIPTGCTPTDVELLTPTINFGNIEQGLEAHRQILILNRSAAPVQVTLPNPGAPFGRPSAFDITIAPGNIGTLLVSFTAGAPGAAPATPVTLTTVPLVTPELIVSLLGTSTPVTTSDVVLVLDRSGSMSQSALGGFHTLSKAQMRNNAVQTFVDLLRDGDRVGMVRFNHDAQPHMALETAGAPMTGSGRVNAAAALLSPDLSPSGNTSIGDGLFQGDLMLSAPSMSTRKSLVVLTDGMENTSQFISDVTVAGGVNIYAIGFGLPQELDVQKLSAITGNAGGYLLVTGQLDSENQFRLHKYFVQILAGISGSSIVVDPNSMIEEGEVQRTPFYVTEGDARFDAVMLTEFPFLRFALEAPDGTIIDQPNVGGFNGQFVIGKETRYYRMNQPVFAGDPGRAFGKWHMRVTYPGEQFPSLKVRARRDFRDVKGGRVSGEFNTGRAYSALVTARSSIQLKAAIEQRSFLPGAERFVVAYLTAFGQPLNQKVKLVAQITRPDGVTSLLPLEPKGNGRFQAALDDSKLTGHYSILVRAMGKTPGNWPLQREQTLSGVVVDTSVTEQDAATQDIRNSLKEQQKLIEQLRDQLKQLLAGKSSFPEWLKWWLILVLLLLLVIAWGIVIS